VGGGGPSQVLRPGGAIEVVRRGHKRSFDGQTRGRQSEVWGVGKNWCAKENRGPRGS